MYVSCQCLSGPCWHRQSEGCWQDSQREMSETLPSRQVGCSLVKGETRGDQTARGRNWKAKDRC